MFFIVEIIGTIAFAISGAYTAIKNKMDIFGVVILGMTTAVGGGIIRDVILGVVPPMAFQKPVYALISIGVSIFVFIPRFRKYFMNENNRIILIMDTLGLAAFTAAGVKSGMKFENGFLSVFVGTLTGVGGGVLRDLFADNEPYIFVKHFYACASLIGALFMVLLWPVGEDISLTVGAAIIITLRLLAAKYRWSLPKA